MKHKVLASISLLLFAMTLVGCGNPAGNSAQASPADTSATTGDPATAKSGHAITLILGGYSTPRDAYHQLIPVFAKQWKAQTGQDVIFQESYQGSGAQSRAIVEGFEADVAALSLEEDINRIVKAGLITHNWHSEAKNGMVSTSVVALAVRKGNPKGIKDWSDLAKPNIEVLTPNVKTSGGAMWNILALYGAALRGKVTGVPATESGAYDFLKAVLKNVSVMDKDARGSITTFEKGIGDVAITYENEARVAQKAGADIDYVLPQSSILIENPVAVIDKYADKHGNRAVAEAFVKFLITPEAQKVFAQYGLRSIDPDVAQETAKQYPQISDTFTVADLGGWAKVTPKYFDATNGIYTKAIAEVQGQQ